VRRADKRASFMCRLSKNLEASTDWNPQGLSRPVMGLLYLTRLKVPKLANMKIAVVRYMTLCIFVHTNVSGKLTSCNFPGTEGTDFLL
jgi:hypothetical protein